MIAALKINGIGETFHAVYWTGKEGLVTVTTTAYCGQRAAAGDGVFQVFEGQINCPSCKTKLAQLEAQYGGASSSTDPTIARMKSQIDELTIELNKLKP